MIGATLGLEELLHLQSGVVARRQLAAAGLQPHDLARLVRRRSLTRLLPGVYVDHTGSPSWRQRAWAACLYHWPAALAGPSALRAVSGPGWRHHDDRGPVHVAVDESRRCSELPGHRLRRVCGLDALAIWNSSPPRMRVEDAVLDTVVDRDGAWNQVGLLADVCQSGRTSATRVLATLERRARVKDRGWLTDVLSDIATGSCSALEHGYLNRVERPHGLPRSTRQRLETSDRDSVRRDVDYDPLPLVVELDGRLFHDNAAQRDRDLDRDLDLALRGRRSVRLGWGQVYDRPCRTSGRVAALLADLGWAGAPIPCGSDCPLQNQSGDLDLPGGSRSPD